MGNKVGWRPLQAGGEEGSSRPALVLAAGARRARGTKAQRLPESRCTAIACSHQGCRCCCFCCFWPLTLEARPLESLHSQACAVRQLQLHCCLYTAVVCFFPDAGRPFASLRTHVHPSTLPVVCCCCLQLLCCRPSAFFALFQPCPPLTLLPSSLFPPPTPSSPSPPSLLAFYTYLTFERTVASSRIGACSARHSSALTRPNPPTSPRLNQPRPPSASSRLHTCFVQTSPHLT